MIYLELFLTFFQVGSFSFGGGYGMIAMIRELTLMHGWLTEAEIINFIAVAESTPGPIAVNMATFVGSSQGGILGSLCATLGVVLPSFIIILIIAAAISGLMRFAGVKAFLGGIRPCVIGLILATALTMFSAVVLGSSTIDAGMSLDVRALVIFGLLTATALISKFVFRKKLSPILMILISAALGMLAYGIF
ncbi:MAG: chromate transporter [Clostridia bacterium]|nr:chromate transporter [Clostridia bacterium]